MKKHLGNLLVLITSLMCVIVLFGCLSINSNAQAGVVPASDLRLSGDKIHFKAGSAGTYVTMITATDANGIVHSMRPLDFQVCAANQEVDVENDHIKYDYLGYITLYVMVNIHESMYLGNDLSDYLTNPDWTVAAVSIAVNEKMPMPEKVQVTKCNINGEISYRIASSTSCVYEYGPADANGGGDFRGPGWICVPESSFTFFETTTLYVRTKTTDLGRYANSDPYVFDIRNAPAEYPITIQKVDGGTGEAHIDGAANCRFDGAVPGSNITLVAEPYSGYRFNGWQVVSGGVTIQNNKFTMGSTPVVIKPVFEATPYYHVKFDPNGGTGLMRDIKVRKYDSFELPSCTYRGPEGKVFAGWDKGLPGTVVTITGDITLKALWEDIVWPEDPEPTDPTDPTTPTAPTDPATPTDPTTPADPTTPTDPGEPSTPGTPADQPGTETPAVNGNDLVVPVNSSTAERIDPSLKATKITKLKAKKNSISIKWKKQAGGTNGYEIQYSTDKKFQKDVKSITVGKAKTNSQKIKKLKSNTKYYFRIRTFKQSGSDKVFSKWSKTRKIKTK